MREFKARYLLLATIFIISIGVIIISLVLKYRIGFGGSGSIIFIFLPGLSLSIHLIISYVILRKIDNEQFKLLKKPIITILLLTVLMAGIFVSSGIFNIYMRDGSSESGHVFLTLLFVSYGLLFLIPFSSWFIVRSIVNTKILQIKI